LYFDPNRTEFPSEYQKRIWKSGAMILPLEVTLPGIDDPETREGCTQIYSFTQEIFEDMYHNPGRYESRAGFIWSVYLFNWMLRDGAVPDETGLCWKIPAKQKSFEEYLTYLAPFGFSYIDKGDYKLLRNDKYPLFLKYWYKMEQKGPKGNADRWANICVCDFRLFSKVKRNTIEDLLRTVPDKYRPYFQEMHDYVIEKGGKSADRRCDNHTYKYKNHKVMLLIGHFHPVITIPYWGQLELFIREAVKLPEKDKLIPYIQNEVVLCKGCGRKLADGKTDCAGRTVEIEGAKRLICVCHEEIGKLHISNPEYTDEDIVMLKRLIDIKFDLIDRI